MSIRTPREFELLRAIGRIVREALDVTAAAVRPGITTAELDAIGARVLARHGAESAPPKVYGFPGALCISINEEAIHGIPGSRVIQEGDLVKLSGGRQRRFLCRCRDYGRRRPRGPDGPCARTLRPERIPTWGA